MLVGHLMADLFAWGRLWILRHIAVGYASHLQRLLGLSWKFLGSVVPGYNDHTEAGSDLRGRIFMTCEIRTSFCFFFCFFIPCCFRFSLSFYLCFFVSCYVIFFARILVPFLYLVPFLILVTILCKSCLSNWLLRICRPSFNSVGSKMGLIHNRNKG